MGNIYTKVTACNYKTNKSYGNKDTAANTIYVGNGRDVSEPLVGMVTTKRYYPEWAYGKKLFTDVVVFKYSLNGVILAIKVFKANKNENAIGNSIFTKDGTARLKGL